MPNVFVFLGAGVSNATYNIPTMKEMFKEFPDWLKRVNRLEELDIYNGIIYLLDLAYGRDFSEYNIELDIEAVLTLLEDIANNKLSERLSQPTILYILTERNIKEKIEKPFRNLDIKDISWLIVLLKNYIVEKCDITKIPLKEREKVYPLYTRFFEIITKIISKAHSKNFNERVNSGQEIIDINLDIFTTNYDYCIEDFCRQKKIKWFNGQETTESHDPIVKLRDDISSPNLYRMNNFQIFKLHGSINWYLTEADNVIHWGQKPEMILEETIHGPKKDEVMIYPITNKHIFREPFLDMFINFRNKILKSDFCFFIGYSFRDLEIMTLIQDSLKRKFDEKGKGPYIYLFSPNAENYIEKFPNYLNVTPVNHPFDEIGLNKLDEVMPK